MVNQKGEFPRSERVSVRVTGSTKRLLNKLKDKGHGEADVIEYAAIQLAKEPLFLEWEIGELELQMNQKEKELMELKSLHQAKLNRLRVIAPKRIDEDTLHSMLVDYAKEYAQTIFDSHGKESLDMLEKRTNSVKVAGEECGYSPNEFLNEVKYQLKIICQTFESDI